MADVAVASQLQQWTFEKRPESERSTSAASSPDLSHHEPETLRIDASVANALKAVSEMDAQQLQDKYLSSEEDLSPGNSSDSDYDYESDASIHDVKSAALKANRISISRWDKGLSCDMAVSVSYVSAGRPKVIELQEKTEKTQRSASLAQLPIAAIEKLRKQAQAQTTRHRSLLLSSPSASASTTRSVSPALPAPSRRSSMAPTTFFKNTSRLDVSSSSISSQVASSVRSASPSGSDYFVPSRPVSSAATSHPQPRSSFYVSRSTTAPFPPLTPASPASHAFLNSDPYENSATNAASPIIKNAPPHRRLRSISMKLSLAKIAITPSTKKWDSRINGKTASGAPLTPATPITPMTAPATTDSSPMRKMRRNSKVLLSRPPTRGSSTTPDLPTIPSMAPPPLPQRSKTMQMVARGANERAPTLELPPFPADPSTGSLKSPRIRKRKSLMDLL